MTPSFRVLAAPRFQRLVDKLDRHHPEFADVYASAVAILRLDPHNVTRNYPITKLGSKDRGRGSIGFELGAGASATTFLAKT